MMIRRFDDQPSGPPIAAGTTAGTRALDVLEGADFMTDFAFIKQYRLDSGTGIGLSGPEGSEECLVVLDAPLQILQRGSSTAVEPPAVAVVRLGDSFEVFNDAAHPTRALRIGVAPRSDQNTGFSEGDSAGTGSNASPDLPIARLDRSALTPFIAHLGRGEILFRSLFEHDVFATNWNSVDHIVLPPATSVGYHRNDGVEEAFVILEGRGRMRINGEPAGVSAGDCIPNRIGGSHGIINVADSPLELLNFSVSARNGQPDATDLGDDLTDLL